MSRTVTAIYSSRTEAESARLRLGSAVKVQSAQVLARETAAALDNLSVDRKDAQACRDALQAGDSVLVATIARGEPEAPIIDALAVAAGEGETIESGPRLSYDIGAVESESRGPSRSAKPAPAVKPDADERMGISGIVTASRDAAPVTPQPQVSTPEPEAERSSAVNEAKPEPEAPTPTPEIRIGQPRAAQSAGGSAPDTEASAFESRAPARRLSQEEVEAGGLLKNRVIEVVEMREEPVISKEVFVREEVVIRKSVSERTETVDDTVRRTEVEVEELP